jgi:hypothetical protein
MKYETLRDDGEKKFRRLTGVKHDIFKQMISILIKAEADKKPSGGKPNNLI